MKSLPPIPTPPALRLREWRIRLLPALVFAASLGTCVWLWTQHLYAPALVGEVEARRAHVVSVQPGTLARLNVKPYEEVRIGHPVAEVLICDPRYLESSLGVVKAEAEVLRLQLDPLVTQERFKVDFERLRLELLNQKVQLATAEIELRYAEAEYDRVVALHRGGEAVASQADLDLALRERDKWREEIASRAGTVRQIEANVASLRASRPVTTDSPIPESWQAAVALQEQRLKQVLAEFGPVTLLAPIAGMVSTVYRQSGENVAAGEPIVTITATHSEQIRAFLLPGSRFTPPINTVVEVSTRSVPRAVAYGRVLHVAGHMDLITSSLVLSATPRTPGSYTEAAPVQNPGTGFGALPIGRPLAVSVPESLQLIPGEQVDLRFLPDAQFVPGEPQPSGPTN